MSSMSDLHQDICTAIEEVMCEALNMEPCERTYEIAVDILEAIGTVEAEYGIKEFGEK